MRAEHLLRLFPRTWRARYGDEFLATAGDEHLGLRQTIDIAACAIDAWTSSEVRRATSQVRSEAIREGDPMTRKLMASCGATSVEFSRRDAVLGALALIGGSALLSVAGIVVMRTGYGVTGHALLGLASPVPLLFAMSFTYLKGKSWRVLLLLAGLLMLLRVLNGFLTAYLV